MLKGIDFSFGGGLTTVQIKDAGYAFVARYLSGGSTKDIDAIELANYKAAKIAVVFVWETAGLMLSEAQGSADAGAAQAELDRLAAAVKDTSLTQATVFFAADVASEQDLTGYMRGVISVLGKARTGIYGGLHSVAAAFNAGLATYGWQTYAWSGSPTQWDDRALLRQVRNNVRLGPATVDEDQAAYWASSKILGTSDDFGQWPRPAPPAPAPKPSIYRHVVPEGNRETIEQLASSRHVTPSYIQNTSNKFYDAQNAAVMSAFLALDAALVAAGCPHPPMPAGLVYFTYSP